MQILIRTLTIDLMKGFDRSGLNRHLRQEAERQEPDPEPTSIICENGSSLGSEEEPEEGHLVIIFLHTPWVTVQMRHLRVIAENLEGDEVMEYREL